MRTTEHAAPQPWRWRGLVTGIPLGLLVVGVQVCLAPTVLTGSGTGAGRAADASAAGARAGAPSDDGAGEGGGAGATVQPTASASPTLPASATPSPSVSATPTASATSTAPASSRAAALAGRIKPAVNECPCPCAPGQLDLSRQAFAKLADLSVGRLAITWSLLSPDLPGTIAIRYKTGSTKWWCGIQVIGHRNPVAALEVRTAGGWRRLPRTDYNYLLSADGAGCGGALRITDIYGEQLTVHGIAVQSDVAQPTGVQFARH